MDRRVDRIEPLPSLALTPEPVSFLVLTPEPLPSLVLTSGRVLTRGPVR
jgi:hypothetical protein